MLRYFALVTVLSCTVSPAQNYTVAPPGYATKEGETSTGVSFGVLRSQRLQWAEGELGTSALALKGFGMRPKSKITSYGRQFSNLTISLADTDYRAVTSTFSTNATSTPTRVFSARYSMPTITGSTSGPSPWDSRLSVAFATTYLYRGTKDLLIDMTFTGGQLSNGRSWGTNFESYYFDAPGMESYRWGKVLWHGGVGRTGCKDRGNALNAAAAASLDTYVFGAASRNPLVKTNLGVWGQSFWTGPHTMVAHVLSTYLIPGGVSLPGVTCNKLYVDLDKPYLLDLHRSDKNGRSWRLVPLGLYVQWRPSLVGIRMYFQAAWQDTVDGRLLLTNAAENHVPSLRWAPKRISVFQYKAPWHIGYGPFAWTIYFPVIRYTH